jgi:TetR/AcrR family fatty acid metabolism transcriptional regulator
MARAHDDADKLRRRTEIIRAAVQVFAERGYFAARMREVAERAGVADGTLYLYFAGKEDLLVSILEEYAEAFMVRARRDIEQFSDPRDKLRAVVERHLASFETDRALAFVFQIELRHTRRFLRRVAKGKVASYLKLLLDVVTEGIEAGVFRADVPPEVGARVIFGALDETVTAWVLAARPGRLAPQAEPILRLILQGLHPPGKGDDHE